ncbi:MAG: hypothetical protein A2234_01750 [Elusimicrobia bacterium RIFOXYA2_FULL_58_8]|nr:MAG: hypothetical protein A2285_01550 [Elusimicrobia bacterium RIFOXYA12_FULL_57_11]OGS12310.1 MAG: hypothetical protein A2234_01750 [Elusimicrobia bacterium RIFOXYA2_FULL_58_8]
MWQITDWMRSGYKASREDGELVFIYRRPDWGTGLCGSGVFYELRNRGQLIGRITAEQAWLPRIKAEWLADCDRPLSEFDLLEITAALKL